MPCYFPITAYQNSKGVYFRDTIDASEIRLPCGRCIGCRLERSRQWALRLTHEKRFHEHTSFITLTYDKDNLPSGGSLDLKHFQDFMKRLRKELAPKQIRFFHAGEYGEKYGRPHYHAIIFGESFSESIRNPDTSERGDRTWSSDLLSKLWTKGINRVGEVTFESCAYVARYCTKKITGPTAQKHYERVCQKTGEITSLRPEYATMSRRPGIGYAHFEKYHKEIYPHDFVISRGHRSKPPRFYDKHLEKIDPTLYLDIKDQRECALSLTPKEDRTPERLRVHEVVKKAQTGSLQRKYEIS